MLFVFSIFFPIEGLCDVLTPFTTEDTDCLKCLIRCRRVPAIQKHGYTAELARGMGPKDIVPHLPCNSGGLQGSVSLAVGLCGRVLGGEGENLVHAANGTAHGTSGCMYKVYCVCIS